MKNVRTLTFLLFIFLLLPTPLWAAGTDRIAGSDRIQTALAIAATGWDSADAVIIAASEQENLMEALVAAPLAGQENAPILLTPKNALDGRVKAKITELQPQTIYVIGSVADSVVAELQAMPAVTVEKLTGADVRRTAAVVNARLKDVPGTFIIGYNAVPDALSAAPFAAAKHWQFVVADAGGNAEVGGVQGSLCIIGGPGVVRDIPGAIRLGGADRYETNALVIAALYDNLRFAFVANGLTMVDALASAPLLAGDAYQTAPVFLTNGVTIPALNNPAVKAKLTAETGVIALGGTGVVPQPLLAWNIRTDDYGAVTVTVPQIVAPTVGTKDFKGKERIRFANDGAYDLCRQIENTIGIQIFYNREWTQTPEAMLTYDPSKAGIAMTDEYYAAVSEELLKMKATFERFPPNFIKELVSRKAHATEIVLIPNGSREVTYQGRYVYDRSDQHVDLIFYTGNGDQHFYAHEIGHMIVEAAMLQNGYAASTAWWDKVNATASGQDYVTPYAAQSRYEDWAETWAFLWVDTDTVRAAWQNSEKLRSKVKYLTDVLLKHYKTLNRDALPWKDLL